MAYGHNHITYEYGYDGRKTGLFLGPDASVL